MTAYAVKATLAKKLRYDGKTSHACDFEFGLKLGLAKAKLYFLDKYTASYRLSDDALSKNSDNNGALIIYQLVEALDVPESSRQYQQRVLEEKAPIAVAQASQLKLRHEASRILFGKWYKKRLLSISGIKGIYHVLKLFF